MASQTIGPVYDRVNSICADQSFTRAKEPFSFDLQPDQTVDRAYHILSTRLPTETGYVGAAVEEQHLFEIFLARKFKRDAHGAARQLKVDVDAIEAVIYDDDATFDYCVLDGTVESEVRLSDDDTAEFTIGRLALALSFDRAL